MMLCGEKRAEKGSRKGCTYPHFTANIHHRGRQPLLPGKQVASSYCNETTFRNDCVSFIVQSSLVLHTNISPSPPEYTIRLLFPNPLKIKHRRETHFGQRKVKCVTSAWKLLHPLHNCHTPFASATVTRSFSDGGCSNSLDPGVILECHCGHSAGVRNKPMVLRC